MTVVIYPNKRLIYRLSLFIIVFYYAYYHLLPVKTRESRPPTDPNNPSYKRSSMKIRNKVDVTTKYKLINNAEFGEDTLLDDKHEYEALQKQTTFSDKKKHQLMYRKPKQREYTSFLLKQEDDNQRQEMIPEELLRDGFSYYTCKKSSCLIHNLYIVDKELHMFVPKTGNTEDDNEEISLFVRATIAHDSPEITIKIKHGKIPEKFRHSLTKIDTPTSIFNIPTGSNLMGTISTAAASWFSMNKLGFNFDKNNHVIILMEQGVDDKNHHEQDDGHKYHELFHYMAPQQPIMYFHDMRDTLLISKAVVGLNSLFRMQSFTVDDLNGNAGESDLRAISFRTVATMMRKTLVEESILALDEGPTIEEKKEPLKKFCFLSNTGQTKLIVNQDLLLSEIQSLPNIKVETLEFDETTGIELQIQSISTCDTLMGMHRSDLAHLFFMKEKSTVIELFPYGYAKKVHQNFAKLLGIRYLLWQNPLLEAAIFNPEYVERHKITNINASFIIDHPLDWMNSDSKMYWSTQNTRVDISSLMEIIKFSLSPVGTQRYMLYMPWEQINNQLIEFKCACAIASKLNRILVLPLVGHRSKQTDKDWDFSFKISDFHWLPFEKYFDTSKYVNFPCKTITMENFRSFNSIDSDFNIGKLHFNPVAKATSTDQLLEYYDSELGLKHKGIDFTFGKLFQIDDAKLLAKLGSGAKDKSRVLTLGAAFWMYGFGKSQPYPLEKYENYMDVDLYKQIVSGLKIDDRLQSIVTVAEAYLKRVIQDPILLDGSGLSPVGETLAFITKRINALTLDSPGEPFIAIHVRRGDYWNKCKRITNLELQRHCYPSVEIIKNSLDDLISKSSVFKLKKQNDDPTKRPVVYIATNIGGSKAEFENLSLDYKLVFFEDLFHINEEKSYLDSTEMALLDMELCSRSDLFVGNFYSSFSRSIFEMRELRGFTFNTF